MSTTIVRRNRADRRSHFRALRLHGSAPGELFPFMGIDQDLARVCTRSQRGAGGAKVAAFTGEQFGQPVYSNGAMAFSSQAS